VTLAERSVGALLHRLGFRRISVRPRHPQQDLAAQEAHKKTLLIPQHAKDKPIELWWQDEARIGQQGTLTRIWAERGSRPQAPATSDTTGPICLAPSVRHVAQGLPLCCPTPTMR
jgi:Winged helix-turn helix